MTMVNKAEAGPDRGWSWVVVFAACFNSLVLAGIFRTSGVLFVAFISEFGVTREEAAWPVVLCISVLNLTGPFSGILGQRYGVRPITILGALVATVGVAACYFTTSLKIITIFFGIVFGIGYGLVSTLMPVIVNVYFLDLRATANGIANSGSCFGSMILPTFFEYVISSYGLSGCFLLTAGVVLHIAIAGALLRPPSWLKKPKSNEVKLKDTILAVEAPSHESKVKADKSEHYNALVETIKNRKFSEEISTKNDNKEAAGNNKVTKPFIEKNEHENFYLDRDSESHRNLHSELITTLKHRTNIQEINNKRKSEQISNETSGPKTEDKNADELQKSLEEFEKSLKDFQNVVDKQFLEPQNYSSNEVHSLQNKSNSSQNVCIERNRSINHLNLAGIDSPQTERTENLPVNRLDKSLSQENEQKSGSLDSDRCGNTDRTIPSYRESTVQVPNTNAEKQERVKQDTNTSKPGDGSAALSIFESFATVLMSPMFYVTSITNVSFYFLFHMYVVIIVDYAHDRGVEESDTKYIIFAFSLADLAGRLCLGWVTDKKYLRRSHFVMGCMAAIGLVFFCFPFASGYSSLIAASCAYGLLLGCTMIVFPILLVDFLGTELHPVAYGCMCFMNGFASFTRPFLIGYFRDNMGSYANIFYILGAISLTASTFWLLEYCFIKRKKLTISEQTV